MTGKPKYRGAGVAGLLLMGFSVLVPAEAMAAGNAAQPWICTRPCWSARAPKSTPSQMSALTRAIVHHTAGSEFNTTGLEDSKADVRAIQNYHMDANGWIDIGYHFLVDKYGYTFEGRHGSMGSLPRGAHDGTNSNSFGFNVMGYFHSPYNNVPTTAMMNALYDVIAWRMPGGWQPYGSPGTYGPLGNWVGYVDSHRRVKATACPGDHVHNPYIGNDVNAGTIRAEIKARIDGRNPSYYFDSGVDGWTKGNGSSDIWWTNCCGWPGVAYADQLGNDMFWYSPPTNYQGGADPSINVQVYPQGGTSSSHDMQLFWKTTEEDYFSADKSSQTSAYSAKDTWISINLSMNNPKYWWKTIKQLRLDFDNTSKGTRFIVNHVYLQTTPRHWFGSSTEGWIAGHSLTDTWWTDCCGWPGILVTDQNGTDAHMFGPVYGSYMLGASNDVVRVRVYPQNGNTANHDMQIFWNTAADSNFSESKSVGPIAYTAQNAWIELTFNVGKNSAWSGNWIRQLRVDFDHYANTQTRWIVDYVIVDHF